MRFQAKKSLGQNFLKSKKALLAMVTAGEVSAGDTVVEIGPGKGALTKVLLETGAKVIAFEKDHRLIELLSEQFAEYVENGMFILHEKDVLEMEIEDYVKGEYKLIANIPYYITGEITRKFLSGACKPSIMVILVQKEVADRIVDTKESILSLSVKVYGTPKKVMKVKKEDFSPAPKVDSAIIKISDIRDPFADQKEEELFFAYIKKAFGQKRKKLNTTLKDFKDQIQDWESIKERRPENLTVDEWLSIRK
jgi:16S rRNA (adenine1518-N6/adenine1519-N6)-dimethyltransferase